MLRILAIAWLSILIAGMNLARAEFRVLHEFSKTDGWIPGKSLTISDGKIYGMTRVGGDFGRGTVFRLNLDGSDFTSLRHFNGSDGSSTRGGFTLIGSTLYGMTQGSIADPNAGTIIRLNTDGSDFEVLHEFTDRGGVVDNGDYPNGNLALSGSTFYGMTNNELFQINLDGNGYRTLIDDPRLVSGWGTPVVTNDKLYWATFEGKVLTMNTDGTGLQQLHEFEPGGPRLFDSLVLSGDTLYGTTIEWPDRNQGTVFKIKTDGTGFTLLHEFAGGPDDGQLPTGNVTVVGNVLYGTTRQGGDHNDGTVFQMNTDGTEFKLLHEFELGIDGATGPYGTLTLHDSILYGTTWDGGLTGDGQVFALTLPAPIGSWQPDSNGSWSLAGNWTGTLPNAAGARAMFANAVSAPRTITVDSPITVGRLDFENANAYTVAGPNALTLDVTEGDALVKVTLGSHTISAPLTLVDNTVFTVTPAASSLSLTGPMSATAVNLTKTGAGTLTLNNIRAQALSINAGTVAIAPEGASAGTSVVAALSIAGDATPSAKLDLNNNAAIIDHTGTSPAETVRQQILSGRGGAGLGKPWNGNGITSSAAAAANTAKAESRSVGYAENDSLPLGSYTNFHGQPVDSTSLLIAYTRTGDANLDGVVNDDDVTIINSSYAPGVSQPSWALGDFDYNGFVDDDDVTLLSAFYDPSAQPLIQNAPPESVAVIPEPASWILGVSSLVAFSCCRSRRCLLLRSKRTT